MAKAIYQTDSGFTAGTVALGIWGHETGSIKQEVIDGDTVNVQCPAVIKGLMTAELHPFRISLMNTE